MRAARRRTALLSTAAAGLALLVSACVSTSPESAPQPSSPAIGQ